MSFSFLDSISGDEAYHACALCLWLMFRLCAVAFSFHTLRHAWQASSFSLDEVNKCETTVCGVRITYITVFMLHCNVFMLILFTCRRVPDSELKFLRICSS